MSLTAEEYSPQRNFAYEWASGLAMPVMSVVLAIIVGGVVLLVTGANPFYAYWRLFHGAFGSPYQVNETLVAAIPFMLSGMAVAFAFRAGLFNIGAEGQLLVGAIVSAWVGYTLNLPALLLIPLALLVGALGGAVWAGIAGVLKAWRGAHEVITTMMLNYVALQLLRYLVESTPTGQPGPWQQRGLAGFPETLPMNAHLPIIVPGWLVPNARLHAGLLVALGMAVLFWFVMWRTTLGYKIRAVGLNPKAAAYAGTSVGRHIAIAMFIAGSFAGLAGMISVFGIYPYRLTDTFSPGYGFDAIAVSLLGKNTPVGVILAAILFGAFEHGGGIMQAEAGVSSRMIQILQGLIIFFVGAEALVRYLARRGTIRLPRWQREEAAA